MWERWSGDWVMVVGEDGVLTDPEPSLRGGAHARKRFPPKPPDDPVENPVSFVSPAGRWRVSGADPCADPGSGVRPSGPASAAAVACGAAPAVETVRRKGCSGCGQRRRPVRTRAQPVWRTLEETVPGS